MDPLELLARFADTSRAAHMVAAAQRMIDLLESDLVEPVRAPGDPILAEELANRLELRVDELRYQTADIEGVPMLEEALGCLRANDGITVTPYSYEDSDGLRWLLLADEDGELLACYNNEPFVA